MSTTDNRLHQVQRKPLDIQLLAVTLLVVVVVYLVLHWVLPFSDEGFFFWTNPLAQWLDWFFWSVAGVLLYFASTDATRLVGSSRSTKSIPGSYSEIIRGVMGALVLMAAVNASDVDLLGLKVELKEAPAIGVSLAFVIGFYPKVADKLFFKVISEFGRRYAERVLRRSLGTPNDEKGENSYVKLHVDPRLQNAYLLAASTESGKKGHEASWRKRVGYKVATFVGNAGFTVNALRTVFIGSSVSEKDLAGLIAHEASHVAQGFLSDSIEQETQAYITGTKVEHEIKMRDAKLAGKVSKEWLTIGEKLSPGQPEKEKIKAMTHAEEKIRALKKFSPLYGIIPLEQKKELKDKIEMLHQASFLIFDFLGLNCLFTRLDSTFQRK